MRYFITFAYDGNDFHGFQRQKNIRSVQGVIEEVLTNLVGENISIKGSGRTDAKVHALNQTAHFDTFKELDFANLKKLLEKENIVLNDMKIVSDDFHARFSVKRKTYCYKINLGSYDKTLEGYVFQPRKNLDIVSMKEATELFLGVHDFRNFVSGKRDNYMTFIENIDFEIKDNILYISFTGKGFYRYMVRNLVGALYDIGRNKITKECIKKMLDEYMIPKQLSTAPAEGLYLVKIEY